MMNPVACTVISFRNSSVGTRLVLPFGVFVIDCALMSCDLKAAAMIYDCAGANS